MQARWSLMGTAVVLVGVLAGCVAPSTVQTNSVSTQAASLATSVLNFTVPKIIDKVRAGGEPVIAITPKGTILVAAHPGWTHIHPTTTSQPPLDLLTPTNAQSYLWRSTDNGTTWTQIGLPVPMDRGMGPRSTGFGVSDPDFTVMADGTICYTDLEGLAESAVSCSTDDGLTWTGNPVASMYPNDRPWLASFGKELYFKSDYMGGYPGSTMLVSTDHGLTWTQRGDTACAGDLVANPRTGAIFVGCGDGVSTSLDHGVTFHHMQAVKAMTTRTMTEPGVDAANQLWYPIGLAGEKVLYVVGSKDNGTTWTYNVNLTTPVLNFVQNDSGVRNMDFVWAWISAGSKGRFAVSWIGAAINQTSDQAPPDAKWYLYTAFVTGADTAHPQITISKDTKDPIHDGAICQGGTGCQVSSVQGDPKGDRRLGDFFETTIDSAGHLHLVVADTHANPTDMISHPLYVAELSGPTLVLPGDPTPTQG
ncbi:MAG: sialidase family protein [Thermoplasmatota archaeon]